MEIRPIKKIGGARASKTGDLEWNDFIHLPVEKLDMVECSCFHQYKPFLYLVTKDSQVLVFDVFTKLLQCKTSYKNLITPGAHRPIKLIQTHNFLCLVFENEEIVCWNSETMALLHVQNPEKECTKKPVIICCESTADPIIFIANHNEQRVSIFDLETFTLYKGRYGSRKPIVGMCVHPTQGVLATCCSGGEIRLWDYKTETLITSIEGVIPSSSKYFLSFNSTGDYFIVGTPEGHICVWGPKVYDEGAEGVEAAEEDPGKMLSFYCSSSLNCVCEGLAFATQSTEVPLVLTVAQGVVMGWDLVKPSNPKTSALQPSMRFNIFSFRDEHKRYISACPGYLTPEEFPSSTGKTWDFVIHKHKNVITCTPYAGFETALGANICIYEMSLEAQTPCTQVAPLTPISHESALWGVDGTLNSRAFTFPTNSVFFLNEQNLWAYSLQAEKGFRAKQLKQPPSKPDEKSASITVGMRTSYSRDASFILWETKSVKGPAMHSYSMIKEGKQIGVFLPGKDIAFCGKNDENYVALQEDGHSLEVGSTSCDLVGVAHYNLDASLNIKRIFSVSTEPTIIALNRKNKDNYEVLLLKKDDEFAAIETHVELNPGEQVVQVAWQTSENGPLGALLTSDRRIMIVDKDINVSHIFDYSSNAGEITSIFWVGYALLCTTGSHLKALYLDGTESILLTLNTQNNYICGVLSDRIILGSWSLFSTNVYSRPLSLLEPLVSAELAYSIHFRSEPRTSDELGARLRQLLAHFEWQRVSPALAYRLLAAGLSEESVILASSPAAFSTNATQVDASVVHNPDEPQLLCVVGDQTPFRDCLQGEACDVSNSSFKDVILKSFHATKEDLGKSGLSEKTLEMAEGLLEQTPSSMGCIGINYGLMDTVGLKAISGYISSNPLKCRVEKTSVGNGTKLFTTVADKPMGKVMWVDEIDANFPLSTLDNKSGFGGNLFNTTGASANPKTKPVIKSWTDGAFCMERALDDLCIEEVDDMEFTKKIDLDVDLDLFDGPLVSKSRTTVTEFDNGYDDSEDTECAVMEEVSPTYRAKLNHKLAPETKMIFSPSAYSKVTKRSLDREVISPTKERKSPSTPKKHVPVAKTRSKPASPATQKRTSSVQAKEEPEDIGKTHPDTCVDDQNLAKDSEIKAQSPPPQPHPTTPLRRPPPPPSPHGAGIQNSPMEKRRLPPPAHKRTPSDISVDGAKKIIGHKKSPSMSQSASGSVGVGGTPLRKAPPLPPSKASPRPPLHSSAPTTPKGGPVPRSPITEPEAAPGKPVSPTPGRRPPPPLVQKKSPAVGHRVPPKMQQPQPRPQQPPRAPILDSSEYQESRAAVIQAWNKRQYDTCLKLLDPHIKKIAGEFAACMEDRSLDKEMHQLISYKSAIFILKRIMATDKSNIAEIAMYTKMLTDLMLHAQHRVDCIRLAIAKNMEAENFGTAAKLIQSLIPLNLPDKKEMEEKFGECKAQKFAEKNVIFYPCPGCGKKTPTIISECKCGTPVKFSCKTFELLKGPIIVKCSVCDALFNKDDVEGTECQYCQVGSLCEFNVEEAAKRAITK